MRPLRRGLRRALGAAAAGAALSLSFAAGVVAGAGSSAPPAAPSVLDEAADEIAAAALSPVGRDQLDAAAISSMLSAAGDPWGGWADDATGAAGEAGVGLWLRRAPSGDVLVARVGAASPAAQAGLRPGDEVRAVAGTGARGAAPARVAALLRGATGSAVEVVVARGSAQRTVRLQRAPLPAAHVTTTMERSAGARPQSRLAVPVLEPGVGRQVRDALRRLPAGRGVLLDLRGNGGGRVTEAVETASAFLDGGPVVSYARRQGPPRRLDALGPGDTARPLVVLVDGGTASAAEVVAAALRERGRAVLVGARTFGKGSVQEERRLSDGSSLEITVARWSPPSGRSVEGVGLVPDIEVPAHAPPDVAVRRGVEVLTGLRAGAGGRG